MQSLSPAVSVTRFKNPGPEIGDGDRDMKLLPPTASLLETSLRTQIKKSIRPILKILLDFLVLSTGFDDSLLRLE